MKIGILSDSHSKVDLARETIDFLIDEGAEFLIHAGDIVESSTLELLANCSKPYIAVYGNNDAHLVHHHNKYNLVQEPYYFKLVDTTFKLMHLPFYLSGDAEVIIFGHTHKFEVDYKGKSLYINPGEVCARNKPRSESVLLNLKESKFIVNYYTKKLKNKKFELKESFSFKRVK